MKVAKITEDHNKPTNAIFYLNELPEGLTEVDIYFERFGLENEYLSSEGWQTEKHLWAVSLTQQGEKYQFSIEEPLVSLLEAQLYTLGLVTTDEAYSDFFSWTRFRDTDGPELNEPEWDALTEKWDDLGLFQDDDSTEVNSAAEASSVKVVRPTPVTAPQVAVEEAAPPTDIPKSKPVKKAPVSVTEPAVVTKPIDTSGAAPPLARELKAVHRQKGKGIKWLLLLIVIILGGIAWLLSTLLSSDDKAINPQQSPSPHSEQKVERQAGQEIEQKAEQKVDEKPRPKNITSPVKDTTVTETSKPTAKAGLVATNDEAFVTQGELIWVDVLKNDSGEGIKIIAISNSEFNERGIAIDPSDGRQKIKYLWDNNRTGSEELRYTIEDDSGNTAQATVTFTRK